MNYQHAPTNIMVIMQEIEKAIHNRQTVTLPPEALQFILEGLEDVVSMNECTVDYLLERDLVPLSAVEQWKRAYRKQKEQS